MYAFTGDPMFKEKAKEVADKLLPAFQTPTGIPRAIVNVAAGVSGFILRFNFFLNFPAIFDKQFFEIHICTAV